jgi:outer membrane protein assembly factor BamB
MHSGYPTAETPETNIVSWYYKTEDFVFSSPARYQERVFIGSDDGKINCLNAEDGIEIWNFSTGDWADSSPAVYKGNVYFDSVDNNVYCLNIYGGSEIWNFSTDNWVYSSPALYNDKLYIDSWDGNVYCLDTEICTEIWKYRTKEKVRSSAAIYRGKVYIGKVIKRCIAYVTRLLIIPQLTLQLMVQEVALLLTNMITTVNQLIEMEMRFIITFDGLILMLNVGMVLTLLVRIL